MYNEFFEQLDLLREKAYDKAWGEHMENEDPLFVCYPIEVEELGKLLETARKQWYKHAGDVKPGNLVLETPEFAVLAKMDTSQVLFVLRLLQSLVDNHDFRMDTVVRITTAELTQREERK